MLAKRNFKKTMLNRSMGNLIPHHGRTWLCMSIFFMMWSHQGIAQTEQAADTPVAVSRTEKVEELSQEALRQGLVRSEEHTSELQSRENLVCRLLLEKKN